MLSEVEECQMPKRQMPKEAQSLNFKIFGFWISFIDLYFGFWNLEFTEGLWCYFSKDSGAFANDVTEEPKIFWLVNNMFGW